MVYKVSLPHLKHLRETSIFKRGISCLARKWLTSLVWLIFLETQTKINSQELKTLKFKFQFITHREQTAQIWDSLSFNVLSPLT